MIFAVVDEGNRLLCHVLLFWAHLKYEERVEGSATCLQTLINQPRSPVYAVKCGYAAIMRGECSRIVLVWRFRGCVSFNQWFEEYPEDVDLLFLGAAANCGQLEERVCSVLEEIEIFGIGDPEFDDAHALSVATLFASRTQEEVGTGIAGRYWCKMWKQAREDNPYDEDIPFHMIWKIGWTKLSVFLQFCCW